MRQLKFRAWDNDDKFMRDWHDLLLHRYAQPGDSIFNDIDLELMQFTGLLDKNGTDIYEGDIVKTVFGKHFWMYAVKPTEQYPNGPLYAIQLYNNCGTDIDEDGDEIHNYQLSYSCKGNRKNLIFEKGFEVVGNIHESPELLEA